ncbi:BrnT family toxin [Bdellovibrio sp. HCB209]|uniref:BrnT family toxin n=1 Tax=Bdellovibrio sp. HCB209 TaxID=3394354 RepID=UPI0039B40276
MYIHNEGMLFQWDPSKNYKNIVKHGVDFDEAASIWIDRLILIEADHKHSEAEDRYLAIGKSINNRILAIVFTFRRSVYEKKEIHYCRIISARSAGKSEKARYRKNS